MILLGDYHTHTKYSRHGHGKGSVLENASVAVAKGLKQIAITDHGYNHPFFGVRRKDIELLREDILNAKEVAGVDILLGIEANMTSFNGDVDLNEEDLESFDIILMGHHKFVLGDRKYIDTINLQFTNGVGSIFCPSAERISKNTTSFLKALDKYPIDIITHLNYGAPTDTLAVARTAREKGVYVELNGKRINFTDQEVITMANEGVKFIVNSDAHSPEKVGEANKALNLIYRLGIPNSLIANLDKLPKFKKKR
jgi:putative hydrolase